MSLYLAIVLLPLGLAAVQARPPRPFWDELATGAGMLAFSIILAEFLLSGRFRTVSGGVGLDVTLRLHQLIARTAVALAFIHPFLYTVPMSPPMIWDASRQYTVTSDFWSLAGGIVAWLLLPVLVLLAIGRSQFSYSYEVWRLMHGVGAALIAGAVLQHSLWAGRYSQDPVLAAVWVAMAGVALASLVFVYLWAPLKQMSRRWRVVGVTAVGPRLWDLVLEPDGHKGLRYTAGQFAWLNLRHSPFSLRENPFSIASAPALGGQLRFIIKEFGDATRKLGAVEPGTRAYLDGPHGNLVVEGRPEPGVALIAGGVGIAPLIGILRQLHATKDPRATLLVYGNRIEEQIVHRAELDAIAAAQGTKIIHVLSEPPVGWAGEAGLIDAALIKKHFPAPDCQSWVYVICGPGAMMETVEETLSDLGVPASQVLSERFSYD